MIKGLRSAMERDMEVKKWGYLLIGVAGKRDGFGNY